MPKIALTLRQKTGRLQAFSVWVDVFGNNLTTVKHGPDDPYRIKQNGQGTPADTPFPGAMFIGSNGAISEINTADGWPHTGDCYEDGGMLVISTGDDLDFDFSPLDWDDPAPVSLKDIPDDVKQSRGMDEAIIWAKAGIPPEDLKIDVSNPADPKIWMSNVVGHRAVSTGHRLVLDEYDTKALPAVEETDKASSFEYVRTMAPNHKSVSFDSTASGTGSASASVTIALVIATNINKYLAGTTSFFHNAGARNLTSVKWNTTETATSRSSVVSAGALVRKTEYSDLLNPTTGSFNVVFTWDGNTESVCGVQSLYGVNAAGARGTIVTATGTDTTPTGTCTSASGDMVLSAMGAYVVLLTDTVDATWTSNWNTRNGNTLCAGAYKAGATSVTRTDTLSGSPVGWGIILVPIVAAVPSVGSASGTSTVSGIGASGVAAAGAASGTSAVSGIGASGALSVGAVAGTSTVTGASLTGANSVGASAGTSTALADGSSQVNAVGASAGISTALGIGASSAVSVGAAAGTSSAAADSFTLSLSVGASAGLSTALGIGKSGVLAVGSAAGTCTVLGYSLAPIVYKNLVVSGIVMSNKLDATIGVESRIAGTVSITV